MNWIKTTDEVGRQFFASLEGDQEIMVSEDVLNGTTIVTIPLDADLAAEMDVSFDNFDKAVTYVEEKYKN